MQQIFTALNTVLKFIGGGTLAALIVIIFCQVIRRYIFHSAMAWPEEMAKYLFVLLAYCGAVLTMYSNKNLRVDALLTICSPKICHLLNILTQLVTACYCAAAAFFTYEMMMEVRDMEQMAASMDIYIWPTWIPIPIGFGIMAVYAFMHLILLVRGEEN